MSNLLQLKKCQVMKDNLQLQICFRILTKVFIIPYIKVLESKIIIVSENILLKHVNFENMKSIDQFN